MAVFRIEKTRDYTVMSNHHLRNKNLSLKAKGLLSLMLSLPEDWDYTTKGLAKICKDGIDSICTCIKELEQQGYVIRERVRNEKGQLTTALYTILEQPETALPEQEKPKRENPILDNPILEKPIQAKPILENPAQLNTNISKTNLLNTDLSSTDISNPILSNPKGADAAAETNERQRALRLDRIGTETIDAYRKIIKANIDYDIMLVNYLHKETFVSFVVLEKSEEKKINICVVNFPQKRSRQVAWLACRRAYNAHSLSPFLQS